MKSRVYRALPLAPNMQKVGSLGCASDVMRAFKVFVSFLSSSFLLFLAPFLRSLSKPLPLLAASLAPLSSVADDELFTPTHASTSQIQ